MPVSLRGTSLTDVPMIEPPKSLGSLADSLNQITAGVNQSVAAYYGTRANIAALKAQAKGAGRMTDAETEAYLRSVNHTNNLDTSSILLFGGLGLAALLVITAGQGRRR